MPFVKFENIAREWRCKWSVDSDNASLMAAQKVLEDTLAELSSVEGVASVQRVVCGGGHDFKVVTKLPQKAFEEWEKAGFAPEAELVAKLQAVPGISSANGTGSVAGVCGCGNASPLAEMRSRQQAAVDAALDSEVDPLGPVGRIAVGVGCSGWHAAAQEACRRKPSTDVGVIPITNRHAPSLQSWR